MQSIFAATRSSEDRQICERMASKDLSLAQRERVLFLTGIPAECPYYSRPPAKKRTFFQYFVQHAAKFATRIENPPLFPSVPTFTSRASTICSRQMVLVGADPLSSIGPRTPSICGAATTPAGSPILYSEEGYSGLPAFLHSQLVFALQTARFLAWRSPFNSPYASLRSQPAIHPPLITRPTIEAHFPRFKGVNASTGFISSEHRLYLFGSAVQSPSSHEDMVPLLTSLQRALNQAREYGYHLHQRRPLSLTPIAAQQSSPPGLAYLKQQRYVVRSHQIAADDYFRKEASHRAAVATRNLNRHELILKANRSYYEPSGIIMPDYEVSRLRVVLAPRKFPVRLWKKEYRGPADWIEIQEKTANGGPVIFKRGSNLRKELILTPPATLKRSPVVCWTEVKASATVKGTQLSPVECPVEAKESTLRVNTQLDTPVCLDQEVAEAHRKALLNKYFAVPPRPVAVEPEDAEDEEDGELSDDPSSSEETLCDESFEDEADKVKPSSDGAAEFKTSPVNVSTKEAALAIVTSISEKILDASPPSPQERHSLLSLSPMRALRAVKLQARGLGF